MTGHIFSNGYHTTYGLFTADLESFLAIAGWTAANTLDNTTEADRAELRRLAELDYISFPPDCAAWLRSHQTSRVYVALTPDM